MKLVLDDIELEVARTETGYVAHAVSREGRVKAFEIIRGKKPLKGCPQQYKLVTYVPELGDDPRVASVQDLPLAENADPVVQRPDGKLYCMKCRCLVPDTANHEMKREGFFAHSHVCGVRAPGEVYDIDMEVST